MGKASYEVLVGSGLLSKLSDIVRERCTANRYAVLTDTTVAGLYGKKLTEDLDGVAPTTLIAFPAGEWNKTRETWTDLTDALLDAGFGRDSAIVALGGGVVGDMAGFVAATYLRGVPYIQVPTTLLAMIDSSVGGKTGVDTTAGRNLVGAFHQPLSVVADLDTLRTLSRNHLSAGMAEALKHGAIADETYFESMVANRDRIFGLDESVLAQVIRRSVEIKATVVSADERESGQRAVLNFGHTVAHAVQAASGYECLHGEAVGIGMILENEIGVRLGITSEVAQTALREAIEAFELPLELPAAARPDSMLEAMSRDKKVRDGTVRFALIGSIGTVARSNSQDWTIPVPTELVRSVLESTV